MNTAVPSTSYESESTSDESDPPQQQPSQVSVSINPQQLQPNLPCGDLIEGSRSVDYYEIFLPLCEASRKGDWIAALAIIEKIPELVRFAITENYDTILHIAASADCTKSTLEFVQKIVSDFMTKSDTELQNKSCNTAFSLAASTGNVEIAKLLLQKNPALLKIPGNKGNLPLYEAAFFEKEDMVRYLSNESYPLRGEYWNDENWFFVLLKCVELDIFDVALHMVWDRRDDLTVSATYGYKLLLLLARKPEAFEQKKPPRITSGIVNSIRHMKVWQAEIQNDALWLLRYILRWVYWDEDVMLEIARGPPLLTHENEGHIQKKYPNRLLFVAAKFNNTRFIKVFIMFYPKLLLTVDEEGQTIFHIAVLRRCSEILNLLYEIGSVKDQITLIQDKDGNNMLHIAAMRDIKEPKESGGVVQMNNELLWYKEVERMIPRSLRKRRNKKGETPYDIFKREHASLVPELGKWMKGTAEQCLVVATLITTMVFAAAFTLPGGYDQNTGLPVFNHENGLIVFVVADAISLVFSSTSVLVFLSMITSRYTEHDIMITLPKKLAFGFATLFLSLVTMMIAFSASFGVLYIKNLKWIPKMVIGLSTMPVLIFGLLHYHLIGDVFSSVYQSRYFFKRKM